MAYCEDCSNFFKPTPEEERMLSAGLLECVCITCAAARSNAREAKQDDGGWIPNYYGVEPLRDGKELYRAEQYLPSGKLLRFIAIPKKAIRRLQKPLRKVRASDLHVTIIGENNTTDLSSCPPIRMWTNLNGYKKVGGPFRIKKTPPAQDPVTGTDEIIVEPRLIASIERQKYEVRLNLTDGGYVRLLYR